MIISLLKNMDCHNKYFHTFDQICEYDINFTFSDKSMGMYELTFVRERR